MDPDNNLEAPEPAPAPAPVETAPAPEPAPAPTETPEDEQPRDDRGRYQRRVDDLTRARGEAEREAAYWRAQALAGKAPSPETDAQPQKPTSDKFASYEEFIEALTEWKAAEIVTTREQQAKQAAEQKAVATTWQQKEAEFKAKTPDYLDVVGNSTVTLSQGVLEGIKESDLGPQLAYHLATHPDVAERISGLPERAALRELGKLEASISSAPVAAPAPAARTSNAPAPIKPVSQATAGVPSPDRMSMDEYVKHRKAQGASWAR